MPIHRTDGNQQAQVNKSLDGLIDSQAAVDFLGVSLSTLWRQVKDKRLPAPVYVAERSPRWRRSELLAALEAQRMTPTEHRIARREPPRRKAGTPSKGKAANE